MIRPLALIVCAPIVSLLLQQPPAPPQPTAPPHTPDYSQEAAIIEQSRSTYRFEKDGTGTRKRSMQIKIQSDAGVQAWGQLVLGFNSANEKIDIEFVRVLKADGTTVTAPLDAVQDLTSPVEREAPVYTDFRQKHVTVAALRPGDTLEFAFTAGTHTALAPGQFWTEYDFARQGAVLDEQLEIDVPLDVAVKVKTQPGFDPQTSEVNGRRVYRWHGSHKPGNEEAEQKAWVAAQRDGTDLPAVRLTTFQKWEDVGRWYAALEATPRRPGAELRRKAEELTRGLATPMERIETLYDYVAKNFRYVSLSLGAGRYQPRAAGDVLRAEYGDCKDKHTLLASLLESIGVPASAALMSSARKIDPDFPSPSQFDHVITRVSGQGTDIWLDTTTEIAPFRLLTPNLRKKQALVVDAVGASHLEETPADPPVLSINATDIDGELDPAGKLTAHVRMELRGDLELLLRAIARRTPRPQWKKLIESLNEQSGMSGEVSDWTISDPADTRRPLVIDYRVTAPAFIDRSKKSVQVGLPFGDASLPEVERTDADPQPPVKLVPPGESRYRLRVAVAPVYALRTPLPVSMTRDFGEYKSEYSLEAGVFSAVRTMRVRQSELPASRAGDYAAFRRVVATDAEQPLSLDAPTVETAAPASDVKAADVNKLGYEALSGGNFARAIELFKRVIEVEPKHQTARVQLARAHAGLRQYEEAIAALKKQIDLYPFDEYAHDHLGFVYLQQQRYTEAEAELRKQLELFPLDAFAHATLGRLYVEWHKYDAAVPELQKSVSLTPKNQSLHVLLGKAYLNVGKNAEAIAAFDRAIEIDPSPWMWNDIAYELASNHTELDRALRYAESAVSATTAASRNISVEKVSERDLGVVRSLAAEWDTLGWVHFMNGDAARAEPFVRASWFLAPHAEVGDHLGQIYEKQGRRSEAVAMYALALNAERPLEETRGRLSSLAGKDKVDEIVRSRRDDLAHRDSLSLGVQSPGEAVAEFFVVFGMSGVDGVRFVTGDERLKAVADALKRLPVANLFPDDGPAKLVRRGTVTCTAASGGKAAGCTFRPVRVDDARADQ
jgi:tetratricopeptide (TPR) repeat protein